MNLLNFRKSLLKQSFKKCGFFISLSCETMVPKIQGIEISSSLFIRK